MKKISLLLILSSFLLTAQAQVDSTTPPYRKFPELPPVHLLLGDSVTKFTKASFQNKPTLIMLFSPDCSHCQHETEQLTTNHDKLKEVQIVMITFHPLAQMKEFVDKYGLSRFKNIVVGKDIYTLLPAHYAIHNLPFHAFYNKKGELVSAFEGSMELEAILKELGK